MKRAVIVRRVVAVETVLHHLIDEPAVDALVEMRRLDPEEEEPEKGGQRDDHPGRPIDRGGALVRASASRSPIVGETASASSAPLLVRAAMRILVTGGCGFIGSNFIRYILQHYKPASVSNVDVLTYAGNLANLDGVAEEHGERYEFFKADIANADQMDALMTEHTVLRGGQFRRGIACRSQHQFDPQNFIHTNVVGTSVLLDCARRHGVQRFVQVSTDEVYGSLGATGKFTEQSPLEPSSPYSASKAGADLLALACHKTFGQEVIVTRCSNNYGPYQFPEKLIPLMIINAMRDDPLPVYGDGMNVRDWIHVEDHCAGIVAALFEGKPGSRLQFRRRQRDAEPRNRES